MNNPFYDKRLSKMTFDEVAALAVRMLNIQESSLDRGQRVAEIRARLSKITTGPWYVGQEYDDGHGQRAVTVGAFAADNHYEDTICEVWDGNHIAKNNADFIASAPADIAYLLGLAVNATRS